MFLNNLNLDIDILDFYFLSFERNSIFSPIIKIIRKFLDIYIILGFGYILAGILNGLPPEEDPSDEKIKKSDNEKFVGKNDNDTFDKDSNADINKKKEE
jgi:hypothetical protein